MSCKDMNAMTQSKLSLAKGNTAPLALANLAVGLSALAAKSIVREASNPTTW
jgi:hypothetical protein